MKRTLALLLVFVMVLSLAACASKQTATTTPAAEKEESKTAVEKTESEPKKDPLPKTIQVLIPLKAGGGTDVLLRYITDGINQNTGKSLVVVNQNEGGGAVCFNNVENAKVNGETIGFFGSSYFTNYVAGSHDTAPDKLRCVSFLEMVQGGSFIVVPASSPYNTFEELVAGAKEKELVLGVQLGSYTHFQCAEIANNAGIQFKYVEATGDAEKVTALLGNLVDVSLINANQTRQYVESGDLKALCCVSDFDREALPVLKDVPTLNDLGLPSCNACSVFVTCVPASMDDATAQAINQLFIDSLNRDDVIANVKKSGYVLKAHDLATSQDMYEASYTSFLDIGKQLGILAEGR